MTTTDLVTPATDLDAWAQQDPVGGRRARREKAQAPRSRRRLTSTGTVVAWIAGSIAFFSIWMVLFALVLSGVQEARAQKLVYDSLRQSLALATVPLGDKVPTGAPVALLSAPEAGLRDVVILEGTSSAVLQDGPGHRRDTVLPGQAGTSVLYGRAVTFGAPFAGITRLVPGNRIDVTTGQGTFTYVVTGVRRPGDPQPQQLSGTAGRLILATSAGTGRWAALAPQNIVYVDAELQGKGQPNPGGRPSTVPVTERLLAQDQSSLLLLMFWLQGFVVASVALVFCWYRWGKWQTWLIGLPIVVALLWGIAENALPLLPNVI
jgi:sortase A